VGAARGGGAHPPTRHGTEFGHRGQHLGEIGLVVVGKHRLGRKCDADAVGGEQVVDVARHLRVTAQRGKARILAGRQGRERRHHHAAPGSAAVALLREQPHEPAGQRLQAVGLRGKPSHEAGFHHLGIVPLGVVEEERPHGAHQSSVGGIAHVGRLRLKGRGGRERLVNERGGGGQEHGTV
jgi:hypothetical protein